MAGYWHDERVRERAYAIWQAAGCPEGKSHEHWAQAEAEIATEDQEAKEEADLEQKGAV
jgi:hypothetical protein